MAALAFVLACIGLGALASIGMGAGSSLVLRGLSPWLRRQVPARRADVAFLLGIGPALAGLSVISAMALPSLLAGAGLMSDHCESHDHHTHVCLLHAAAIPAWLSWVGALAVGVFLWRTADRGLAAVRQHRRVVALERLGSAEMVAGFPARRVPGAPRLCFATGLWRRRIVYSASLADHLAPDELSAALAHEAAHLFRRDAASLALLSVAGLFTLPTFARRLRSAFLAAAEEACDASAAARHGGETVARALVAAARLQLAVSNGLAFAGQGLAERVSALLTATGRRTAPARALPIVFAFALASSATVGLFGLDIHHAVETLVSALH